MDGCGCSGLSGREMWRILSLLHIFNRKVRGIVFDIARSEADEVYEPDD